MVRYEVHEILQNLEVVKIMNLVRWKTLGAISLLLCSNLVYGWTLQMDFNDGALNDVVNDSGKSYHVFSNAAGHTTYSNCDGQKIDGQCARMSISKGHDGWGTWGGRINFNERGLTNLVAGSEVWISVRVFMPEGFDYSASPHLKFLRLHTKSPSSSNEGYNDWYITPDGPTHNGKSDVPFFFVKEQQNLVRYFGDFNVDRPIKGQWENYEIYMKMDYRTVDEGGTSRVRVWKNGRLLGEFNDMRTLNKSDSYAGSFLIFTYWNGGNASGTGTRPTKDQHLFIDDLIITTDRPSKTDSLGNHMIGNVLKIPSPPHSLDVQQ